MSLKSPDPQPCSQATPKYKSKNPLSYAAGTTRFYHEAITKHQITITEGDTMAE